MSLKKKIIVAAVAFPFAIFVISGLLSHNHKEPAPASVPEFSIIQSSTLLPHKASFDVRIEQKMSEASLFAIG